MNSYFTVAIRRSSQLPHRHCTFYEFGAYVAGIMSFRSHTAVSPARSHASGTSYHIIPFDTHGQRQSTPSTAWQVRSWRRSPTPELLHHATAQCILHTYYELTSTFQAIRPNPTPLQCAKYRSIVVNTVRMSPDISGGSRLAAHKFVLT